ncbi:MAG TPA: radical SAM protein [Patescibacteria group bacterium]|nr:radical SAM protein [Patescibacteria group bacterium]
MKLSRFNVWTPENDSIILYNSLTGALITFEAIYYDRVFQALSAGNLSGLPDKFLPILVEDGFLVEDQFDELEAIRNLVVRRQQLVGEYFFSILLSLSCNFRCGYCFENHTGQILGDQMADRIVQMMSRVSQLAEKIAVDWYGGEPLISFPTLRRLNDRFMAICSHDGTKYETSITTNGYLLTPEIIKYLTHIPITHLQITIDGPPETHNISRPLKDGGPTFDVILDNIVLAVENGLDVFIRTNITRCNIDQVHKLYPILAGRGLKNKVRVLLKPVVSSPANPCEEDCLDSVELSSQMVPIYI